jgi:peptidoglycan/LPS O-acetylase OafA/YrhL
VSLTHPKYRPDIDGLRAVAVLSVVAFHAFPGRLPGGFIGVDVFFVISGFLISTIIFENLPRDSFGFAEFYRRRIRRIFPALLIVLVAAFGIGWAVLFDGEFVQISKHVAAGAAFISNFALWQESGYFDTAANAKPLLHLWSLGIEEQFYIIWPLLLYWGWRLRVNLFLLCIVIAAASFAANISTSRVDAVAIFYSPQTRFWELLVGAIVAIKYHWIRSALETRRSLAHVISSCGALLLLIGLGLVTKDSIFPGWLALLPTFGTALLIAAGPAASINRWVLSVPSIRWFGLISYPLYLWHWPLLSFAYVVTFGAPPSTLRIAIVAVSILLAWLTYIFIETPIRFGRSHRTVPLLGSAMAIVSVAGVLFYLAMPSTRLGDPMLSLQHDRERKIVDTFSDSCVKKLGLEILEEENCRTNSPDPLVLFIGDSHAGALSSSVFVGRYAIPSVLVSGAGCKFYPTLNYTPIITGSGWGHNCTALAREAVRVAAEQKSITTVVVTHKAFQYASYSVGSTRLTTLREEILLGVGGLIEPLLDAGKKVIYVKDVPPFKWGPEKCVQRIPVGIAAPPDCRLPRAVFFNGIRSEYDAAIAELAANYPSMKVVDPTGMFCDNIYCYQRDSRDYFYNDTDHLSVYGSTRVIGSFLLDALPLKPSAAQDSAGHPPELAPR